MSALTRLDAWRSTHPRGTALLSTDTDGRAVVVLAAPIGSQLSGRRRTHRVEARAYLGEQAIGIALGLWVIETTAKVVGERERAADGKAAS